MNTTRFSADSTLLFESLVMPVQQYSPSAFHSHSLSLLHSLPAPHPPGIPSWSLGVIIFCFLVIAWNHVYYPKRMIQVLQSPFSKRFINQLVREGNLFNERIAFTLGIAYFLSFSLFLYLINERLLKGEIPGITGIRLYGLIIGSLLVITIVKTSIVSIIGSVFRTTETTYHYLLNQLIFSIILAPIITVFLVLILYVNSLWLLYLCLSIVLLVFIFRFLRGFLIGMALTKFSYMLLFVYLCSLEILPLLVLAKLIAGISKTAPM